MNVLEARTLSFVFAPDTRGVDNGSLSKVAWSADGGFLHAAGRWVANGGCPVRRWSGGGRGAFTDFPLARSTVMDLAPLSDGCLIFGAADPAWGVLSQQGQVPRRLDSAIADFRDNLEGFQVSKDGRQVRFGYELWGKFPAVFDLGSASLGPDRPGLSTPVTSAPGLTIKNWKDETNPSLNGRLLALEPYEASRSLAIARDGAQFALGTEWYLRLFDRTGRELWKAQVPGAARSVNISGDGCWVVAAYGDGTIHWHRMSDGHEVLALFPHADRKRRSARPCTCSRWG